MGWWHYLTNSKSVQQHTVDTQVFNFGKHYSKTFYIGLTWKHNSYKKRERKSHLFCLFNAKIAPRKIPFVWGLHLWKPFAFEIHICKDVECMVSVRIITREIGELSKACKDFLKNLAVFTIFSRFSRHCYHLDLVKYSDNVYAVHICCDADYRFGLGSGFISISEYMGWIL